MRLASVSGKNTADRGCALRVLLERICAAMTALIALRATTGRSRIVFSTSQQARERYNPSLPRNHPGAHRAKPCRFHLRTASAPCRLPRSHRVAVRVRFRRHEAGRGGLLDDAGVPGRLHVLLWIGPARRRSCFKPSMGPARRRCWAAHAEEVAFARRIAAHDETSTCAGASAHQEPPALPVLEGM